MSLDRENQPAVSESALKSKAVSNGSVIAPFPAPPPKDARLTDLFDHWFETKTATTADEVEQAYRLRYQVYCVENAYEEASNNPDGLERDAFDQHAVHSILIHRPTQTTMGAVRLVLPLLSSASYRLPIQEVWQIDQAPFPWSSTAEISRYAISREFRRRTGEERYADATWQDSSIDQAKLERRVTPHITLGLMKSVLRMSVEHQITHVCAVMEPALIRLLKRFGLEFHPLGPLVDYHGRRQPCYAALEDLLTKSRTTRSEFWEVGTDSGKLVPKTV